MKQRITESVSNVLNDKNYSDIFKSCEQFDQACRAYGFDTNKKL